MLKVFTSPTRQCKRCLEVKEADANFLPTGLVCWGCARKAAATLKERKAAQRKKWYISYATRIKAQRSFKHD